MAMRMNLRAVCLVLAIANDLDEDLLDGNEVVESCR